MRSILAARPGMWFIVGFSVWLLFIVAGPLRAPAATLYLVGDSTMADKPVIPPNPERGWGQMLPAFFQSDLVIENHAVNGRSSKSFMAEHRWSAITNKLQPGDWVIVQFGHNDEKKEDPKRFTEPDGAFKTNLDRYVTETRHHGANVILATPVVRRQFGTDGILTDTHGPYVPAMREVAGEMKVPLLELNTLTSNIVQGLGPERSKKLYLWVGRDEFPNLKSAKEDDTHFCAYGATRVCDLAVAEIQKVAPELAQYLHKPGTAGASARRSATWLPESAEGATNLVVASEGSGTFRTVQEAIMSVPAGTREKPVFIHIKPGTYKELIYFQREKRFFHLVGEAPEKTLLSYNLNANLPGPDGKPIGTFRTASTVIDADDFTAENLTFENLAGPVGQALAIRIEGDRVKFRNCRFLGWQDTILTNRGRHLFQDCYIEGHVDFIFGGATAYFENCRIHCLKDGYITAASTPDVQPFGFVFSRCTITGGPGVKTYLGRPWRNFAATAFLNTEIGEVVRAEGWDNWRKPEAEKTARYAEFANSWPGARPDTRVKWVKQLSADEARAYTRNSVLRGSDGWNP